MTVVDFKRLVVRTYTLHFLLKVKGILSKYSPTLFVWLTNKEITMSSSDNRIIQYDILRIVAALAVVWLHTSAQRFYICYPSVEWDARNFYDSLVRWAVPIFVMISGALFLDSRKKIDVKNIYTKNITRVVLIFFFWSIVYALYDGIGEKDYIGLVRSIVQGPFHFWFLKMLIGLYIIVPLLKVIVVDKKLERYYICLSLVTAFIIPMLFPFIGYFSDGARDFVEKYYDGFGVKIALGYVGYFVLGHYLANNRIKDTHKIVIYILGILSVFVVCVLTYLVSSHIGAPTVFFYGNLNVFTLFEAVALFILIKDVKIAPKYHAFFISVSKISLGIYIIHPFVMNVLFDYGNIDSTSLNSIFFIPLFAIIVFIISYCVSFVLIRIPIIKKFLM